MSKLSPHTDGLDLTLLRSQLADARGSQFWRSLNELADNPEFRSFVDREFPQGASELADPVSRRTFLKLAGASLALAGLTACGKPPQNQVAPFARAPLTQMPGIPLYYATTLTHDGFATGVVVKNNEGRPTKIEGNPRHPVNRGSTDIYAQAEILNLYDPDRPAAVLNRNVIDTWENFLGAIAQPLQVQRALQGGGLRLLTGPVTSPSLAAQIGEVLATYPSARWYQYSPVGRSNSAEGARLAFGDVVDTRYRFAEAQVVLSLDADFLAESPGRLAYAREFIDGRRARAEMGEMNRLYIVEPVLTNTGIVADHRLPLKAGDVLGAAFYIASALGVQLQIPADAAVPIPGGETGANWLKQAVEDLRAAGERALVVVGESQPPLVHALAHAINAELGAVGNTLEYTDSVQAISPSPEGIAGLRELVNDINGGLVELLVMIDVNPVYTAPADLGFAEALDKINFTVLLGRETSETGSRVTWFLPQHHELETWGDARAYDGTTSLIQPLILPLYDSHSPYELLSLLLGQAGTPDYDIVRAFWQEELGEAGFDTAWNTALESGVLADTVLPARTVTLNTAALSGQAAPAAAAEGLELVFRADPTIYDGRYANNGWLQELPSPLTKLTWDNAALVSPRTAVSLLGLADADADALNAADIDRLGRNNGRIIEISSGGRSLRIPLWITPGHAENTITLHLGYGRSTSGRVAAGAGFNTYALRGSDAPWFTNGGVTVTVTTDTYQLVSTQDHGTMEGRDIVRVGAFEKFREDPKYIAKEIYEEKYGKEKPDYESMVEGSYDFPEAVNAWGMTIDLTACIGCNACTIACQAENNIPVVGKEQVAVGREMHWIRIDRYYGGANLDNPTTYVMPVTCMQCEQAPCEIVCPVAATVHDNEGINNMVYNRCVGTKYCSNNCPYKVRRFNFLQYTDTTTPVIKLLYNPQVTVRNRGVMEKCTYCVQRISAARIDAKRGANRPLADGEVVTACQQACPTQAIIFGDIKDTTSQVAQLKQQPHNYTLLDELNTKPRTSYLARVRNPNSNLEAEA
jgi:MoCo/4Fe-4S cofactor protein with predicted Tat translocation signal